MAKVEEVSLNPPPVQNDNTKDKAAVSGNLNGRTASPIDQSKEKVKSATLLVAGLAVIAAVIASIFATQREDPLAQPQGSSQSWSERIVHHAGTLYIGLEIVVIVGVVALAALTAYGIYLNH